MSSPHRPGAIRRFAVSFVARPLGAVVLGRVAETISDQLVETVRTAQVGGIDDEAIATGAKTIAVACPFCMTMLTDGVKEKDAVEKVQVKDIAELVLAAVEGNA